MIDEGFLTLVPQRVHFFKYANLLCISQIINEACTRHVIWGYEERFLKLSITAVERGVLGVPRFCPQLLHNINDPLTVAWRGYEEDIQICIGHIRAYVYPEPALTCTSYESYCTPNPMHLAS